MGSWWLNHQWPIASTTFLYYVLFFLFGFFLLWIYLAYFGLDTLGFADPTLIFLQFYAILYSIDFHLSLPHSWSLQYHVTRLTIVFNYMFSDVYSWALLLTPVTCLMTMTGIAYGLETTSPSITQWSSRKGKQLALDQRSWCPASLFPIIDFHDYCTLHYHLSLLLLFIIFNYVTSQQSAGCYKPYYKKPDNQGYNLASDKICETRIYKSQLQMRRAKEYISKIIQNNPTVDNRSILL